MPLKLKPETMELLGSTKNKITKGENGENVPHLEINELVLILWNIANSDYQLDSRVLYIFIRNKSFGQLLNISTNNFTYLKTFNSYIEVWFTDQNSKSLEIENAINITLVITESITYKNGALFNRA